jgi:DNA (cytosine-5)-methyltransferase 1
LKVRVGKSLKAISLFAGAGGLDFGAEQVGMTVEYANEIDADASATLRKYFPHTDVDCRDVNSINTFPSADILIGGYPCQSFSMGGKRNPEKDSRTALYLQFARCLGQVQPKFFVAENVSGLWQIEGGRFLRDQFDAFEHAGNLGYRISFALLDAKDYGVPQTRKRVFLVGVRRDLGLKFEFPLATHGKGKNPKHGLLPYASHGEAIKDLPLWPSGEFYERPHDPDGHMSWYFMSRNRKAKWDGPAFTAVANFRHVTLHPACPVMKLTWSNLADGFKQRWDFSNEYEHLEGHPNRPRLDVPRRLSWRECARIQTFPRDFEPVGNLESKFRQIGNAVPVDLAAAILRPIADGSGLHTVQNEENESAVLMPQLALWSEAL